MREAFAIGAIVIPLSGDRFTVWLQQHAVALAHRVIERLEQQGSLAIGPCVEGIDRAIKVAILAHLERYIEALGFTAQQGQNPVIAGSLHD
jgi:hypothetical protein